MNKFDNKLFQNPTTMSVNLDDIFGISREIPLSYAERDNIDDKMKNVLSADRHIFIYGTSKQGKSSLVKKYLPADQYTKIQCVADMDVASLFKSILKQSEFRPTQSEKRTKSKKGLSRALGEIGVPFFGKAKIEASGEVGAANEELISSIDLNYTDVNDIITALKKCNSKKFIVLDDFHRLKRQTQETLVLSLKAFYDNSSIIFIIIAVCTYENRIFTLNSDMIGRITEINADIWKAEDLIRVIEKGSALLNIQFEPRLVDDIIMESYDNIYYVHEICRRICQNHNINQVVTGDDYTKGVSGYHDENDEFIETNSGESGRYLIANANPRKVEEKVSDIAREIINQSSILYTRFFSLFSKGFNKPEEFGLYKWILFLLINSDDNNRENNLRYENIEEVVVNAHPNREEITRAVLLSALTNCSTLQESNNFNPYIIEYDEVENKINIVDKGLIMWLQFTDKNKLLKLIGVSTN